MKNYEDHLAAFMKECDYPAEAVESLLRDYHTLCANDAASERFHRCTALYEADQLFDYAAALDTLEEAANDCGVHVYVVQLLFALCLARHAKELYDARGISPEIYRMSMLDMKWKLYECHRLHGVWGTMTAKWFGRFFYLTRFALGRLQFEPAFARHACDGPCGTLRPGDLVINMHIPSCGPLTPESCMDSFRQAETFFAPLFNGRPVAFMCSSWLLHRAHEDFLPPQSNIRQFMSLFHRVAIWEDDDDGDLWRIFYKTDYTDLSALPQETALQRAYVAMLQKGGRPGGGTGYFFMKDGMILR